jgi:hypothetical protein
MPDEKKQVALLSLIELGLRDEKASEFSPIRPWQLCSVLSYTMLWGINVLAFYSPAITCRRRRCRPGVRSGDACARGDARDVFVLVYAIGAPLVLAFAMLVSCLWKKGGEGVIFCCARAPWCATVSSMTTTKTMRPN